MKKSILAILGLSLVLAVFGLVSIMGNGSKSNAISTIGTEKAKEIAFTNSGYAQSDAREISVDFEKTNGRDIYEVEFEINNLDFDYFIDAYTGAIIESKIPTVSAQAEAMANSSKPSSTETNLETNTQPAQETNTQPAPEASANTSEQNNYSSDQSHHSTQTTGNTAQKTETTTTTQNTTPAKNTAPSQDTQSSATPAAPQNNTTSASTPSGIISESEAKNLVLARVPGATSSNFTKFHLDFDDGRYEYEGELIFNDMEYDFEIDAYSGNFREWDAESIYD